MRSIGIFLILLGAAVALFGVVKYSYDRGELRKLEAKSSSISAPMTRVKQIEDRRNAIKSDTALTVVGVIALAAGVVLVVLPRRRASTPA